MYSYSRTQVNRLVQIRDRYDMRIIAITGPLQVGKTVIAVRGGKALSCGGCNPHPTPVAPVGSNLNVLWR